MAGVTWTLGIKLADLEKMVIKECMILNRNNKKNVSDFLGITVRTIDNKLEQYREEDLREQKQQEDWLIRERKKREHLRGTFGQSLVIEPVAPTQAVHLEAERIAAQHDLQVTTLGAKRK